MTFTREQIDSIEVGKTKIAGHWASGPALVVEIFAKREDIHGKLFVCGYHEFGSNNGRCSFSIKEGDKLSAELYTIHNEAR